MARQNRVDPFGNLVATPARGTLMGNRGCLHDINGNVIKRWARLPWVTCLLDFKGRHREIMAPGKYTELFFLDEATALSAGHRPCGTCQKARYNEFKHLWIKANGQFRKNPVSSISDIDAFLHDERYVSAGEKSRWKALIGELPDGSMISRLQGSDQAWLKWQGSLHRWTPGGYDRAIPFTGDESVLVITPKSIVRALVAGFAPKVHASAQSSTASLEVVAPAGSSLTHAGRSPEKAEGNPLVEGEEEDGMAMSKGQLYRLEKTPGGKVLFAYFAAILRVTGLDRGKSYPLKKFLKSFSTHEQAGRIEKVDGGYRLTRAGIDYFTDRYQHGNPQHVNEVEVRAMVKGVLSGGPGWEPIR